MLTVRISVSDSVHIIYSLLPGSQVPPCALMAEPTVCILEIVIPKSKPGDFASVGPVWEQGSGFLESFSGS